MKIPSAIVYCLLAISFHGCVSKPPAAPRLDAVALGQATRLRQAREHAALLQHGLTRNEITARFGAPHKTEGTICGGNSAGGPWTCLAWTYSYPLSAPPFYHETQLLLFFEKVGDDWQLNSWQWLGLL